MSTNMKEIEFQASSYNEWQDQAVKALKGKPFESLFTKTMEGITLEPLYTQESLIERLGDELEKQVATIRSLTKSSDVEVAQQIIGETADAFISNLEESLARGNEVITIDSRLSFTLDSEFVEKLADYLTEYSFKITVQSSKDPLLVVFDQIEEAKRVSVEGFVLGAETIQLQDYPNVRTYAADTVPFHNDGANAVQELAIALAQAAEIVQQAPSFEEFASKFFVNFAVDTQFFVEIAKLRAFKVLWKAFASAFGKEASAVPVVAETSVRSFSKLDVYVNLLRAGNEAFSAVIGGADVVTVHPHDILSAPTEQSARIARNVLLVTIEESLVLNVLDPSGGSYFIESLTADYIREAWALFLEIECAGGLQAYGIAAKIEEVYAARLKEVETRKHSLIGTNIYANPVDALPTVENAYFADVKRLALPFENLRTKFAEANAKIAILTFGELKNFKLRADFVTGFLATAGVVAEQSEAFQDVESAKAWLNASDYNYVIIAATDDDMKALVPALLDGKRVDVILDAAGKYKDEQAAWVAAGLNGFIFAGQNIPQKLMQIAANVKEVQR